MAKSQSLMLVREARSAAREAAFLKVVTNDMVVVPLSILANFALTNQLSKGEDPIISTDQAAILRGCGVTCSVLYFLRGQDVAGVEIGAAIAAGALAAAASPPATPGSTTPLTPGLASGVSLVNTLVGRIQGWLGPLGRILP